MTEKCFDIGVIQAFLDGELAPEVSENVARHVALCDDCALSLASAEEETAFAFSVLEQEFNTLVPTHRLWTKINDSIERQEKSNSLWQTVFGFVADFKSQISNQMIAAFASLLIVVGLFMGVLVLQKSDNPAFIAEKTPEKQSTVNQTSDSTATRPLNVNAPQVLPDNKVEEKTEIADLRTDKNEFRAVKTVSLNRESKKETRNIKRTVDIKKAPESETPATNENLAGEESYIKTIASLTETVSGKKDEVLKPSARFAFEKDLAVVDDAITKMKAEVKKNPKNEGAKQVLLASYQNKIDLLNSVAEKNELMASLR